MSFNQTISEVSLSCESFSSTDNSEIKSLCNKNIIFEYFLLQETYPQSPPIWFSEDEDQNVSSAIERLSDTSANNYGVCILFSLFIMKYH